MAERWRLWEGLTLTVGGSDDFLTQQESEGTQGLIYGSVSERSDGRYGWDVEHMGLSRKAFGFILEIPSGG